MTMPRSNNQPYEDSLKKSLLGDGDNDELKLQTQHVVRFIETVDTKAKLGAGVALLFQNELTGRAIFENGSYKIPDGQVMAIIREDMEECIDKGYIQSREEGRAHIKKYVDTINNFLNSLPANTIHTNAIENLQAAVTNQRDQMRKTFTEAPPRERPSPEKRTTLNKNVTPNEVKKTPNEPVFDKNNLNEEALLEKIVIAVKNATANMKHRSLQAAILKECSPSSNQTFIHIISDYLKESMQKGYIKSSSELKQHTQEYIITIKETLTNNLNNNNINIVGVLEKALSEKRKDLNFKNAEPAAKLQEAKNMYAHTYRGIKTASSLFVSTRRLFSASLKEREQKMTELGMTPEEIKTFKKELQSKELKQLKSKSLSSRESISKKTTAPTENPRTRKTH